MYKKDDTGSEAVEQPVKEEERDIWQALSKMKNGTFWQYRDRVELELEDPRLTENWLHIVNTQEGW